MGEKKDNISPIDHLALVSSYVLVIVGEHIIKHKKNLVLARKTLCSNVVATCEN